MGDGQRAGACWVGGVRRRVQGGGGQAAALEQLGAQLGVRAGLVRLAGAHAGEELHALRVERKPRALGAGVARRGARLLPSPLGLVLVGALGLGELDHHAFGAVDVPAAERATRPQGAGTLGFEAGRVLRTW